MDKKIIEDWLKNIATPTGISYSGDQTISEDMVEDIVDYVAELEQQCKKQKEVIDRIQKIINTEIKLMGYAVNDSCLILIQDVLKEVSE